MAREMMDVVALGAAIVDVLAQVDHDFIAREAAEHGMHPGAMTLIDEVRAVELYAKMPPAIETSGGSGGNTIAGIASFGGKTAFIAKTAKDQLGDVFAHDLRALGVHYDTQPIIVGGKTSRCLILVTPDGERTMNTYIGASALLSPDDIDSGLIVDSRITYLEGYLFDQPRSKEAFRVASDLAHGAGRVVALSLSDPFCVERHRDDFRALVRDETDILFANEAEIISLYQTGSFEEALAAVRAECDLAVLTRSAKGSVIVTSDRIIDVHPVAVDRVVDTTGAGDQYAAGFLFGYARDMALEQCGALASAAAAEVVSHLGPRPAMCYADLLRKVA